MAVDLKVDYHSSRDEFLEKATKIHLDSLAFWKNGICAINKLLDQLTFQRDDLMSKFSQVTTEKAKLKQEYEEKIQSQVSEIAKLQNIVALLNDKLNERNRSTESNQSLLLKSYKTESQIVQNEENAGDKGTDLRQHLNESCAKALEEDISNQDVIVLDDESQCTVAKNNNEIQIKQEFNLCGTDFEVFRGHSVGTTTIHEPLINEIAHLNQENTGTVSLLPTTEQNVRPFDDDMSGFLKSRSVSLDKEINFNQGELPKSSSGVDNIAICSSVSTFTVAHHIEQPEASAGERKDAVPRQANVVLSPTAVSTSSCKELGEKKIWSDNTFNDDLKCYICFKGFKVRSDLERHCKLHEGVVTLPSSMVGHGLYQGSPKMEEVYKCHVCKRLFLTETEYERHLKTHDSSEPVLDIKVDDLAGSQSYRCPTCIKSFTSETEWRIHQSQHDHSQRQCFVTASELYSPSLAEEDYKKIHKCTDCQTFFFSLDELQKHPCHGLPNPGGAAMLKEGRSNASRMNTYTCTACSATFNSETQLKRHQVVHVAERSGYQAISNEKRSTCHICQRSFTTDNDLKRHLLTHNVGVTYNCGQCPETFVNQYDLNQHYRVHTEMKARRFKCSFCEKRFHYLKDKNRHEHVHTGYKPFQCDMCQKRFSRKDSLQTHLRTHSGEKPHHCEYCGKYFAQRSGLNSHVRSTHASEFAYKCDQCPKRFKFQQNYRTHLLSHSETS